MQKTILRFGLLLKSFLKNRQFYILILLMGILCYALKVYAPPKAAALRPGGFYVEYADAFHEKLAETLVREAGFIEYKEKENLKKDVETGALSCGFVLKDDIGNLNYENLRGYTTDFYMEARSSVAQSRKEAFFDCFLKVYSDSLIRSISGEVFGNADEALYEKLMERRDAYLAGDELFFVSVQYEAGDTASEAKQPDLVRGVIALCVFFMVLFMGLTLYEDSMHDFLAAFSAYERNPVTALYFLAGAVPIMIAGLLMQAVFGESFSFGRDVLKMLALVAASVLLSLILRGILKSRRAFSAVSIAFLPLSILICPVFIRLEEYITVFSFLKYLFPVTYYL